MHKSIVIILVIFCTFFWGANFNFGKHVVEHLPPLITAATRFSLASLLIIAFVFIKEKNVFKTVKQNFIIYVILGLIGIAGFNELLYLGLKNTSPVNVALIMATNPILTMLLSVVILKDSITRNQKIGALISLFGLTIVITNGSLQSLLLLKIAKGDLIVLGANFCWAIYGVLIRRNLSKVSPLITTATTMVFGTLIMIMVASTETYNINISNLPWTVYASLIYMAAFGSVVAYFFWNIGVTHMGASKTSVFYNLVPVFTVLISICLGKPVSYIHVIGGIIVIFGVTIASIKNSTNKEHSTHYKKQLNKLP